MERRRIIAAAPVRSATDAWQIACSLITQTLERSPVILPENVTTALAPLNGLGPALIAGGHLESKGLVLCDIGLHVTVCIVTADAALNVVENLNPVPGGGQATDKWILYVPLVNSLADSIAAAVKISPHLSIETPPDSAPKPKTQIQTENSVIDLEALRKLGATK